MARIPPIPIRFVLVFWLFLLSAVAFLDRTNISIAGISLSAEYHLGDARLGWVFSAFLLGYAAFQVPGGWLAGRFGPRLLLTLGVLWWGVFTVLTTVVPSHVSGALALLIAVRFALGAGEAVIYPASNQFIARWIPVHERGRANGWIFAGVGTGAGLTPPLLTSIIAHYGWRASFWFSAVVGFAVGAAWFLLARDAPEQHPRISPREVALIHKGLGEPVRPVATATVETSKENTPALWTNLIRSRNVWALTFSYFTFGYVAWIFFSWFYIYLAKARHLDLKTSAAYTMLPFIAMTICCLLGGFLNDWGARRYGLRVGRCMLGSVSLVLTAFFLAFGSAQQNARSASIVLAASVGALYLSQSSYWSVTADVAGTHSGLVSGMMNMGCQIGGAVTASLTPVIAARFGWNASFLVAAALSTLGALAWLVVDPTRRLGH